MKYDPTFTDGTYNLLTEARWSTIINTPTPELNVALDTALQSLSDSDDQLKGWYDENLKHDARWADYTTHPESNANYAWILHMISHLKPLNGVVGFLRANDALGDSDTVEIREKLIKNDKVEAIILLPRALFITTDISVTLWLLNQNKKGGEYHGRNLRNRAHEILFMDLRQWRDNPVQGENKKKICLSAMNKSRERRKSIMRGRAREPTVAIMQCRNSTVAFACRKSKTTVGALFRASISYS